MQRPVGRLAPDMRIAVIGTGHIGSAVGEKLASAGHEVAYGARSVGDSGPGGKPIQAVPDAAAAADVVVLAIPGGAVARVVAELAPTLHNKVVVDASNNIRQQPVNSHDAITAAAPEVRYVRAFNTLGWENFAQPLEDADLFFAADPRARPIAEELITAVGLRPVFVGDATAAGIVDGLLPLWFALVTQRGGNRRLAFRVVEPAGQ
jgi:8-hydroxy-5-deazaflavin:NADPH oxidoreductase